MQLHDDEDIVPAHCVSLAACAAVAVAFQSRARSSCFPRTCVWDVEAQLQARHLHHKGHIDSVLAWLRGAPFEGVLHPCLLGDGKSSPGARLTVTKSSNRLHQLSA